MKYKKVLLNTTPDEVREKILSIDGRYECYKKEWTVRVRQKKNQTLVLSAVNRFKAIRQVRGNEDECAKKLYIKAISQNNDCIIEFHYKFQIFDLIWGRLLQLFFFLSLIVLLIAHIIWFFISVPMPNQYTKYFFIILFLFIVFAWPIRMSIELEKERYEIMKEVINKQFKEDII